ncbi:helix-turn-helix domain-containing protein [Terricaulis silvestris]|uniref:HTH-type transcriptional regulator SinR n=1 Tax=Terricaulis silvestris TaxID=2686094 RepID=A0A6I6MPG5_9CAUL|nr:helix-turn-helix transcriptional regulator [Terricaulis silvestris]QGZ96599.1 HTH-type transcriptional regulator SinR [Terricaulis silvestris]
MDIRGRLARNVKAERSERGWSQEDLADASGLDRTYISGIERQVRNPTIVIVERLAKALKTTASALLD